VSPRVFLVNKLLVYYFSFVRNPGNVTAQTAVIKFANFLAGRFNPLVGCTRSWNTADPTDFQVITSNMI